MSDNVAEELRKWLRRYKELLSIKHKEMVRKAEDNYQKNQDNPGPSKESIEEPNDDKAGRNIPWTVIIAIVIMLIAFFLIFGKHM